MSGMGEVGFDGKMLRKTIPRKTVDFNPSAVKYLEVSDHLVDHLGPDWTIDGSRVCGFRIESGREITGTSGLCKPIRFTCNRSRCRRT